MRRYSGREEYYTRELATDHEQYLSRQPGRTSNAMIPSAAVAVRSDPNIDRPGALRVDLSTAVVAAAWRRPAGRT
jgi:hypothetical protein